MRNKKRLRMLAMATAIAVLTTTISPQGMVYASEPVGEEVDENVKTDSETDENVKTDSKADENVKTDSGADENVKADPEADENAKAGSETDENVKTDSEVDNGIMELTDNVPAVASVIEDQPEADDGVMALADTRDAIPSVNDIVTKHTVNVEKGNPESEDTAGKDTNWKLVWSDEFNGNALDTTKWGYQVGNGSAYGVSGWGNNELEYYTAGDNISFRDGQLVITAKKQDKEGSTWTSAKLWTLGQDYYDKKTDKPLFQKKYGRIEAKLTLPEGTGLWPAFWMMPVDDVYGGWASSGEIDIMEARGRLKDSVDGTIHFGNASPNNKNRGGQYDKNKAISPGAQNFDFTGEHEYALEWLPGQLKWYVDDECYFTTSNWYSTADGNGDHFTYPAPFDQEFFIMLNLAVGGNYDGGRLDENMTSAEMKVDYVRVYDLCDDASGTLHDYAEDEKTVSAVSSSAGEGGLLGGTVGDNFLTGNLKDAHPSIAAEDDKATSGDTPRNEGWYLLTQEDAEATVGPIEDAGADAKGAAKVDIKQPGNNGYSVQFSHQFPLTEGYAYELTFDAKSDSDRNITIQMSDYVYTSFDGSWAKYSDLKTIGLSNDWRTYNFTFSMTEQSDEYARLELNLGAGGTGGVYFRNAKLVATGKNEGESEDKDKEPLSNGEHIYNGTFDQGGNKNEKGEYTRMRFWDLIGGAAGNVANDRKRSLTLSPGTSAEAGIEQKNVQLLANEQYKLTFDADGSRNITVQVVGNDGTQYHQEDVVPAEGQEVIFTVPKDARTSYGKIRFLVGSQGGSVTLDNVSMKRETNKNADWSTLPFHQMQNPDFVLGEEGWNVFNDGPPYGWVNNGTADHGDADAYHLDIDKKKGLHIIAAVPQNGSAWCVGIQTRGINTVNIAEHIAYTLKLDLTDMECRADEKSPVKDEKTLYIQMPDGTMLNTTLKPGDNKIEIPYASDSNIEGGQILLQFGANSAREFGTYEFYLKYMNLELNVDGNDKNDIPEDYKTYEPAPLIRSAGSVELGNTVVINHYNDGWADNIRKVYVNEQEISLDDITIVPDQILISKDVFEKEGSYKIRFESEGYLNANVVTQEIFIPSGKDILKNGDFKDGLNGWGYWASTEKGKINATFTAQNEQAVISVVASDGHDWDVQFSQEEIEITHAGNYILTFDAYATKERPIKVVAPNLQQDEVVYLTTEKTRYAISIPGVKLTEEGVIQFWAGNVNGCLDNFESIGAHSIYLDNVSLLPWSLAAQEEIQPPELKVGRTHIFGEDVTISYAENTLWEAKSMTINVDGKQVDLEKVAWDAIGNTFTIDHELFEAPGRHTIAVTAEGYQRKSLFVYLAPSKNNLLPDEFKVSYDGKDDGEQGEITTKSYGFDVRFEEPIIASWGGAMFWTMQARDEGLVTLDGKEYVLTFDAELKYTDPDNTDARGLMIEYGNDKMQEEVKIKPGKDSYSCTVEPGANADFYLLFMAGATEENVAQHTLNVSNIKLIELGEDPAEKPVITTSPVGNKYAYGAAAAAMSVVVEKPEKGTLTYQWWRNRVESTAGAVRITGATSASYTPDTTREGTTYYFCRVTNTVGTGASRRIATANSDYAKVEVAKNTGTIKVESVKLPQTLTLNKGKSQVLTPTFVPVNATNKKVSWKSDKPAVAKVEQNGRVTAVAKGTAKITVTTADGNKTASCTVTVKEPATKVKLNAKKVYVVKGKSVKVKATMTPKTTTDTIKWSAKNTKVATVNKGKIKGKKVGNTNITATATSGKKATLKVYVVAKTKKSTSIKLNKKNVTVKVGATYDLVATLKPATSTDTVKWKSSAKKVASVDAYGTVTGKKKGTATITATTSSGKKYTCKVKVK